MILLVNNTGHADLARTHSTHALAKAIAAAGKPLTVVSSQATLRTLLANPEVGRQITHVVIGGSDERIQPCMRRELLTITAALLARCSAVHVLGVCFGMQLLAELLGGAVGPGQGSDGWHPTSVHWSLLPGPHGGPATTDYWYRNSDRVTLVPPGWAALGTNLATGEVAGMRWPGRHWYGVQFHPELSEDSGKLLLLAFLQLPPGAAPPA